MPPWWHRLQVSKSPRDPHASTTVPLAEGTAASAHSPPGSATSRLEGEELPSDQLDAL